MAAPIGKLVVNPPDPRINYNLLPGEKLMTCPYNLSHAILPIKFAKHVLNCHRLHCIDQKKLGKEPLFSICRYDRSHHVKNAELAFHESECPMRPTEEQQRADDEFGESVLGAVGGINIKLDKPPEVGKEILNAIFETEDWETEPEYNAVFDPDKKIMECRQAGYNVIQTHKVVGLTKSEKKEFYKADAQLMRDLGKANYMSRLKDGLTVGRRSSASSSVSVSALSTASAGTSTSASAYTLWDEDEEA